jgi:hypothetical protein
MKAYYSVHVSLGLLVLMKEGGGLKEKGGLNIFFL